MAIYRGRYYGAAGCDSGSRPGMNALMSWYLGAYASRGAANLGTYACKRLGSGWSIHAERRAGDFGTKPYGGVDSTWGWELANALRLNSDELGVQLIILGNRIWSCTQPDAGWRPYGGDYHGHAHVELIPRSADLLTAKMIEMIIGGGTQDEEEEVTLPRKGDGLDGNGRPLPNTHRTRETVRYWQRRLNRLGFSTVPKGGQESWRYDGIYGDGMQAAVATSRVAFGVDPEDANVERITAWHAERMDSEVSKMGEPPLEVPDLSGIVDAAVKSALTRVKLTL